MNSLLHVIDYLFGQHVTPNHEDRGQLDEIDTIIAFNITRRKNSVVFEWPLI